MTDREQEVINNVLSVLKKRLNPDKIILFGSRAKGISAPGADIDLALEGDRPGISVLQKLNEEIDQVSGLYSVDLVFLNDVDVSFKEIIMNTGKVIYER
ncbi:MAG: nucleotidyltransferase domain-containing protein [Candidatus Omnitrophota bacterium]